jgi:probable F420-dependent oxidoreductase
MEVGLSLPFIGELATRDAIERYARAAESSGYDAVWVGDHVLFPTGYASSYPYSRDWAGPPSDTPVLDPLACLSFVAALTTRVHLGTSVLLLPARNPVLSAKSIATLDVLSGGRAILGVGVGWLQAEYDALGAQFERRGERADEYLDLIRLLWSGQEVDFHGQFYSFAPGVLLPRPVQRPHPRIWIGGHSPVALRRVAAKGNGWIAAFAGLPELRVLIDALRSALATVGRSRADIDVAVMVDMRDCGPSVAEQTDTLGELEALGVDHVIARTARTSVAADLAQIEAFVDSARQSSGPRAPSTARRAEPILQFSEGT